MTAALHEEPSDSAQARVRREFMAELGIDPTDLKAALDKAIDYGIAVTKQALASQTIPDGVGEEELYYLTDRAPHETVGVLRMLRGGMKPAQIAGVTGIPQGPQLAYEFGKGLDQEGVAFRAGLPVFDGMKEDEK
ncbi:hypothetical protein A5630_25410 [Mycolicibacterium mucogenicum]|uniref:Gp68-like predicted RNA polymerase component domain-containing protein n=1 Tax=Mycolicibacterium mucogenicum TaxID=56689 RepID=A0A1A3GW81_MYCMU|nr:hypothetical protein [Mycolicibacterium mucogenicum]OBJ40292.1 hypothetical protein A5630_25410 [Mycolicibacterium mucogenicum]